MRANWRSPVGMDRASFGNFSAGIDRGAIEIEAFREHRRIELKLARRLQRF
ncbi:hypothetical protein JJD41_21015 [Oxynema sp. CENA135]|uniref:hypothetical protein n=1 Tax=Oxynema sp. CENA135 TaxID=984206 RepID=UPI00190AC0A3|nr:hypothetical protein [Oxynema sp. CENA135]MBK4732327.1 hypothetical protein [Oxynema sp. CENA135]